MSSPTFTHRTTLPFTLTAAFLLALQAIPTLHAADVTWSSAGNSTAGGDGNWTGGSTWWNGSSAVTWTSGDNATFSAAGNTTVNSSVTVGNITFSSSAANISILGGAGDITLNSGITATNTANTAARTFTISESIALGANQTWTVNAGGATGAANLTVSGIVSGTNRGITKEGNGTLTLSGANTFNGSTTVNSGSLILTGGGGRLNGALTVDGGGVVLYSNNNNNNWFNKITSFTLSNGGTFIDGAIGTYLQTTNPTVTFVNGGTLTSAAGADGDSAYGNFRLLAGINATGSGLATISAARISLQGSQTITVADTVAGSDADLVISSSIRDILSSGNTLTKAGAGTLLLTGNNTSLHRWSISAGTLEIGAAGRLMGGNYNGTISNSGTFIYSGTNSQTLSGVISGTGALTQNGSGTLTLSGNNTYNGTTTINAGTLEIGAAGRLGAGTYAVNITNNATLIYSGTNAQTLSGVISGTGNLTQNSSSTFTLTNNNTYTGTTTINAGTLEIGAAGRLNSGSYSNTLSNSGTLIYSGTNNQTLSGVISGSGALTKNGSATLILTANNTYTGGTTVNAGTLQIGAGTNTSAAVAGTTTLSGGTLTYHYSAAKNDVNGAITLTAESTITRSNTHQVMFNSGTLNGGGQTLNVSTEGTDMMRFDQTAGTSLGQVNILKGSVGVGSTNYALRNATINVASGAQFGGTTTGTPLTFNNNITLNGGAGPNGYGALTNHWWGTITYSGSITLASATDSSIGTSYASADPGNGQIIISGQVVGSGSLTKINGQRLTLSGNNTYTGTTTISAGILEIGAAGRLGGGSYSNTITNNGTLIYSGTNAQTLSGVISGTGNLTQNASSTLTLSGNNTYTGTTTINAGTLEIGAAGRLGGGSYAQNITNNATLVYSGTNNQTLSGVISGTGGLTKTASSGTLTLSGNNTFAGNITINNNSGTLELGGSGRLGGGSYSGNISIGTNSIFTFSSNTDQTLSGVLSGAGNLNYYGTGTLTLSGSNTMSGTLNVGQNFSTDMGTIVLQNSNAAGTKNIAINDVGTIELGTSGLTIANNITANNQGGSNTRYVRLDLAGTATGTLSGTIDSRGKLITFDVGTDDTLTLSGAITNTSGLNPFSKSGSGTLLLTGNSTYGGTTTISAGTWEMGAAGRLGGGSYAGAISNNGTFIYSGTNAQTLSGVISGTGALTQNGSGTLTLTNTNTYSGGTTLNTGTLVIGNTAAAGSGTITQTDGTSLLKFDTTGTIANAMSIYNVSANKTVTLSGGITVNNAVFDVASGETLTISNTINGTGGVTKNGTGTLVLSGNNSYQSATVINAGTLNAASAGALGSNNTVDVNGGTLLVSANGSLAGKNIDMGGSGVGLRFSGNYFGAVGALTLSADSSIDLGTGSVQILFQGLNLSTYTLSFYNWTGLTLSEGGTGADTDKVFLLPAIDPEDLNKISFYSGNYGSDSFLGTGFDLGLKATDFTPAFGNQIIPVPEPETYATGLLLLLGGGLWMWRKRIPASRRGRFAQSF